MKAKHIKPRDPSMELRSRGVLKERVIPDKKKVIPRKSKHKGKLK